MNKTSYKLSFAGRNQCSSYGFDFPAPNQYTPFKSYNQIKGCGKFGKASKLKILRCQSDSTPGPGDFSPSFLKVILSNCPKYT